MSGSARDAMTVRFLQGSLPNNLHCRTAGGTEAGTTCSPVPLCSREHHRQVWASLKYFQAGCCLLMEASIIVEKAGEAAGITAKAGMTVGATGTAGAMTMTMDVITVTGATMMMTSTL